MVAKNAKVLVVDDDPAVLWLAEEMLSMLGYQPLCTSDGKEALDIARDNPAEIGLLLTDVVMPAMNGPELALKFLDVHPDGKVLFMSGFLKPSVLEQEQLRGRSDFLLKPFTTAELKRSLKNIFSG